MMTIGNDKSHEQLLEHRDFVQALAARLIGEGEADDAVQESWLRVLQCQNAIQEPKSWLATTVRNVVKNRFRARARQRGHEQAAGLARHGSERSAQEVVARLEVQRRVVEAVLALPEPFRTPLILRFYDERPPREIARELDIPVETVRSRIRRGLSRLRSELDADEESSRESLLGALVGLAEAPASVLDSSRASHRPRLIRAAAFLGATGLVGWLALDTLTFSNPGPIADQTSSLGRRGDERSSVPMADHRSEASASSGTLETRSTLIEDAQLEGLPATFIVTGEEGERPKLTVLSESRAEVRPLPGAVVHWAILPDGERELTEEPNLGVTDGDGALALPADSGWLFVAASHEDHVRGEARVRWPSEYAVTLTLAAQGSLEGTVSSIGAPSSGAVVHVARSAPVDCSPDSIHALQSSEPTDSRGHYRIDGIEPGRELVLVVEDPTWGIQSFPMEPLAAGERMRRDLVLERVASISGQTMPRAPSDLVTIRLSVQSTVFRTERYVQSESSVRSMDLPDGDRDFRVVPVAIGEADLVVQRREGSLVEIAHRRIQVKEPRHYDVGELAVELTELHVRVQSVAPELAGAAVRVHVLTGGWSVAVDGVLGERLVLRGLPPGRLNASAALLDPALAGDFRASRSDWRDFEGQDSIELTLEPKEVEPEPVHGCLEVSIDGAPHEVATLWIVSGGRLISQTWLSSGDHLSLDGLPPGRWTMIVSSGSRITEPKPIAISRDRATRVIVEGPFRDAEPLIGQCRDVAGDPVPRAHVLLHAKNRGGTLIEVASTVTREDGTYRFDVRPPLDELFVTVASDRILAELAEPRLLIVRNGRADLVVQ